MDNSLYEMIFKRKSFHLFRNIGNEKITIEELEDIKNWFNNYINTISIIWWYIRLLIFKIF